jgi:hypothetical protein
VESQLATVSDAKVNLDKELDALRGGSTNHTAVKRQRGTVSRLRQKVNPPFINNLLVSGAYPSIPCIMRRPAVGPPTLTQRSSFNRSCLLRTITSRRGSSLHSTKRAPNLNQMPNASIPFSISLAPGTEPEYEAAVAS